MSDLHNFYVRKESQVNVLNELEKFSVDYHNLFDYPLNLAELIRWTPARLPRVYRVSKKRLMSKNGFYFLEGRENLIYKRILRNRLSTRKITIAKKTSKILSFIPTVKMVAVSGSLAMQNAVDESDIDLLIVTQAETLWLTRLFTYLMLKIFNFSLRKPGDSDQKDKLCLNMWMDEHDLNWEKPRNIYTAHELAQISPLVNKDKIYDKFLSENVWVLDYWPNSVKIQNHKFNIRAKSKSMRFKCLVVIWNFILNASNLIAFKAQHQYMKGKITRETITLTRAIFHPRDLSKVVLDRLST